MSYNNVVSLLEVIHPVFDDLVQNSDGELKVS